MFPLMSSQMYLMQNSNAAEEMRIFSLFYYCTSELQQVNDNYTICTILSYSICIYIYMKLYCTIMYNMELEFLYSEKIVWIQTNGKIIIQERELF